MKKEELDKKLENLNIPTMTPLSQQQEVLKLAIINAKTSVRASIWLLSIPVLILLTAAIESFFHVLLPPWYLLKTYSGQWPLWVRQGVFLVSVIIIPFTAVLLNLLSIIWLDYDRTNQVLNVAIRMKKYNLIILALAGMIGMLFLAHIFIDPD